MSETHAYEARMAFVQNIAGGEASLDLALAALQVAAEDDATVSHSSVSLPVEAYSKRIDALVRDVLRMLGTKLRSPQEALKVRAPWGSPTPPTGFGFLAWAKLCAKFHYGANHSNFFPRHSQQRGEESGKARKEPEVLTGGGGFDRRWSF